jgi:(p)ppGpp synthase/HD superfamily hydrolase
MNYPPRLRKVGIKDFLYGDFDKDRVKNVDDPRPFDSAIKSYPNIKNNPRFYHKSRYGGGEIKLSTALRNVERYGNQQRPFLKKVLREQKNSYGRIKTIPSVIDKLTKKHIGGLSDVSALSVITQNRKQAYQAAKQLKKVYKTDPKRYDDYYRKPLLQHRALHLGLVNDRGVPVEVQVKSSRFARLDDQAHSFYKRGRVPIKLIKRGQELYNKGY